MFKRISLLRSLSSTPLSRKPLFYQKNSFLSSSSLQQPIFCLRSPSNLYPLKSPQTRCLWQQYRLLHQEKKQEDSKPTEEIPKDETQSTNDPSQTSETEEKIPESVAPHLPRPKKRRIDFGECVLNKGEQQQSQGNESQNNKHQSRRKNFWLIFGTGIFAVVAAGLIEIFANPPEWLENHFNKMEFDPPAPFLPPVDRPKPLTLIIDVDTLFNNHGVRTTAKDMLTDLLTFGHIEVVLWEKAESPLSLGKPKMVDEIIQKYYETNEDDIIIPLEILDYRKNSYEKGRLIRRLNLLGRELTNVLVITPNPSIYSTRENILEVPQTFDDLFLIDLTDFIRGITNRGIRDIRQDARRWSRMGPYEFLEAIRKKRQTAESSFLNKIKKMFS